MDHCEQTAQQTEIILIVDDKPANASVFADLLAPHYQVLVSNPAGYSLRIAHCNPKPDLILLDVMLPKIDSYQILSHLQANPRTREIPVLFVSVTEADVDNTNGLQLGEFDFMYHPCQLSMLLTQINAQLEQKKTRELLNNQNASLVTELAYRQHEYQKVQLQLMQSEKLAAIGQLATGIAHEISNPISFVHSNLHALRIYLTDLFEILHGYDTIIENDSVKPETLEKIQTLKYQSNLAYLRSDSQQLISESLDGLSRVSNITRDLKNFSRADQDELELTDLHKSIDSTLNIISNELKYHCTVRKIYQPIPPIYCHSSQLNQVFMNLLINAGQAIKDQGEIIIRTDQDSDNVWVEISDSGQGIRPEHINRLFEPFFTTKPLGQGTGLGLSISHNIVKKHGGRIEVNSEIGKGATFRVYLPINNQESAKPSF